MGQRLLNERILERIPVSGIPRRFCRGSRHHHQLGKGRREPSDIDRTPQSLIITTVDSR